MALTDEIPADSAGSEGGTDDDLSLDLDELDEDMALTDEVPTAAVVQEGGTEDDLSLDLDEIDDEMALTDEVSSEAVADEGPENDSLSLDFEETVTAIDSSDIALDDDDSDFGDIAIDDDAETESQTSEMGDSFATGAEKVTVEVNKKKGGDPDDLEELDLELDLDEFDDK
jgi:hypothetical protein